MTDDSVEAAGSSLISARLRLLEAMAEHEEFGDAFMAEAQGVLDAVLEVTDLAQQFAYVLKLRGLIDRQMIFLVAERERLRIEAGYVEPDAKTRILQ